MNQMKMNKMNQIKNEQEGKTPYTKQINTHVQSGSVYTSRLLMGCF